MNKWLKQIKSLIEISIYLKHHPHFPPPQAGVNNWGKLSQRMKWKRLRKWILG